MRQEETEMLAFFYLCGKKDQKILMKKEKMSFKDFQRFDYLTRRLDLWEYNKKIWKDFAGEFKEKLRLLEKIDKEGSELFEEIEEQEKWWESLSKNKELFDSWND